MIWTKVISGILVRVVPDLIWNQVNLDQDDLDQDDLDQGDLDQGDLENDGPCGP